MPEPTLTPLEHLKAESRFLRGPLVEDLASPEPSFSKDGEHLLKPHGFYQQKDRSLPTDQRIPILMIRGRIPGGRMSASQYLTWDRLAGTYGDGTLRLTTRQDIELHGILKGDAKALVKGLHESLQTSFGACGDVVRNITQAPNPRLRPDLAQLDAVTDILAHRFKLRSRAYAEIWLDGEKVDPATEAEPIHGPTYLPRKFKIAVTTVGENLVDIHTNDLAFAATFDPSGLLEGFFVFAGGGMGMTHGDANTFPRLADQVGWIPRDALESVAEAVVTIHRDFGDRTNRKRARLKYVLHQRGLEWFRSETETRSGTRFQSRPLPPWNTSPVLGWIPRTDGTWALGFHTLSGRIADTPGRPLRTALRTLVETLNPNLVLTPDQDLILTHLDAVAKTQAEALLTELGINPHSPSKLHDRALACVALPLCGLAVTEGERSLPDILESLRQPLERHGLQDHAPLFRMTGCANGCARPYAAELALVGRSAGSYALYAGGHPEGIRLAFEVLPKVAIADLPQVLERTIEAWAQNRYPQETFGDWSSRLGPKALAALAEPCT